ncbi:MAG: molybdopterin biosynthesis protein [Gemmatales bacterium]|nr:molybdopterin biosynthesis protein [Gemmatales bacterium]MDW7993075.1 molybdopterin biosynthesis protein [Gemmatales bacterium]
MRDWQQQFLQVVDRDEAERRFRAVLDKRPRGEERVLLGEALGRVLSRDVTAPIDVPGFDRANVDGFAVRAADTFGAEEIKPVRLRWTGETIVPGRQPRLSIEPGTASAIATGAMLPRGADAVVMVEVTGFEQSGDTGWIIVRRAVTPGSNVTMAGTDIGQGEVVLRRGEMLTARETAVLAALGIDQVWVVRRPRVAILSTGDELVAPGQQLQPGQIYDSNATMLADAVRENGGEPTVLGIVPDDPTALRHALTKALQWDLVLLSGGTSKGAGDLCYQVVAELGPPGILVHGVALKPGKPLCLAVVGQTPIVILPGFPTSAIFTFYEFVAPVIREWAGFALEPHGTLRARLPLRMQSERGRTEYVLVNLVEITETGFARSVRQTLPTSPAPSETTSPFPADLITAPMATSSVRYTAYPIGKGSGSVTAFSRADGFIVIPKDTEMLEAGEIVEVRLLGREIRPADLVVIGSHCVGLDYLLGRLQEQGWRSKTLAVGSMGGLAAAQRGECDVAGIHLLDEKTGDYNRPFVTDDLAWLPGYGRLQGIAFRRGDPRFSGQAVAEAVRRALADPQCILVNRNRGSGTRILIDQLLQGARPPGYMTEARSHHAVAAAIAQGRADWGVCIEHVAREHGLDFLPVQHEWFDFVVPKSRLARPAVQAFQQLLRQPEVHTALRSFGFVVRPELTEGP